MQPLSFFQGYRCCAEDDLPTFQPRLEDISWHTAQTVSDYNSSWAQADPWPGCTHLFQVGEISHEPFPPFFPPASSVTVLNVVQRNCSNTQEPPEPLTKQTRSQKYFLQWGPGKSADTVTDAVTQYCQRDCCKWGSSQIQSPLPVVQSLPLFSSVLQITTKQCQFIQSLFIRLLFYIPDYSHCFPQCHSSLSRPFVKCYPQNCRDFKLYHHPAKQRLHHMPCRLNSYLYVQVQHLPLSQQYTTTFSL